MKGQLAAAALVSWLFGFVACADDAIVIVVGDKQVPSFIFREISQNLGGPNSLSALGKLRFNAGPAMICFAC